MMKVILSTGNEVEIIGPIIKSTREGMFISHREFEARIDGETGTITMDELENAKFPNGVEDQMKRAFDNSLEQVKLVWSNSRALAPDVWRFENPEVRFSVTNPEPPGSVIEMRCMLEEHSQEICGHRSFSARNLCHS